MRTHNRGSFTVNFVDASLSVQATFGEFSPHLVSPFWTYVDQSAGPDRCWPWVRSVTAWGYGQLRISGDRTRQTNVYAHRLAWVLASNQVIPKGQSILHTCDNPACCNPTHLVLGDHQLNMDHAVERGRFHTPRPTKHKVTTAQLAEIDALLASGVKHVRIADQFGVSKAWVSLYVNGRRRQYDRPAVAVEKAS